jgi:hypothetical protein
MKTKAAIEGIFVGCVSIVLLTSDPRRNIDTT